MFTHVEITLDEFKAIVTKHAIEQAQYLLKRFPPKMFNTALKQMLLQLDKSRFLYLETEFNRQFKKIMLQDSPVALCHKLAKSMGFSSDMYYQLLTYFQWRVSTRLCILQEVLSLSDNLIQGSVIQQTTQTFLQELQEIHAEIEQHLPFWLPVFDDA